MTEDHQPIQEEYKEVMNKLAHGIDNIFNPELPRTVGFVLFVFEYGDHDSGRFNYISNGANRKDIAKLMREQAAKFEAEGE